MNKKKRSKNKDIKKCCEQDLQVYIVFIYIKLGLGFIIQNALTSIESPASLLYCIHV